jgi:hypothetical protein
MGALQSVLAYLITMSLAAERLVAIVKTIFPSLSEERKTDAQEVDLKADRKRRLILQVVAIASSWLTVGLAASAANPSNPLGLGSFDPFLRVEIGTISLPLATLAILTSGGSALWNNVMGYTKAIKDTKQVEKAAETVRFHQMAKEAGSPARAAGESAGVNARN